MDGVFGLAFGRPSVSKAVKIALGCSLAVLLARLLELSSATAVVTITLLSVQRTKRTPCGRRCAAAWPFSPPSPSRCRCFLCCGFPCPRWACSFSCSCRSASGWTLRRGWR